MPSAAECKVIGLTVRSLLAKMEGRFKNFPNDYLVLDLETTGLVPKDDLITQIGFCLVKDRKVVDQAGIMLGWPAHPAIDQAWLQKRLLDTKRHVENDRDGKPTGKTYHTTYEKLCCEGVDPIEALRGYYELCKQAADNGMFYLLHNGIAFDVKWLEHHFQEWLGQSLCFDAYSVFDSGMTEKAAQAGLTPWEKETPQDFYRRMGRERLKGVFWSLDAHCVPKYGLAEKYGLDLSLAHDAGMDCRATAGLFEEFLILADQGCN